MRSLAALVLVVATLGVQGQKQGGGRFLSLPDAQKCANRPQHWKHNGHSYFFSGDIEGDSQFVDNQGQPRKMDWLDARNICRERCMDAVSMETEGEAKMIFDFIRKRNITYIWTSGRMCDFTGCEEREDLKPLNVNGFFWSGTNTKMAPTNKAPPGWSFQPWSSKGHTGGPQPDNAEFAINKTPESCMAVLNNIYNDGIAFHDIGCYHKKPVICEDNQQLLAHVNRNGNNNNNNNNRNHNRG